MHLYKCAYEKSDHEGRRQESKLPPNCVVKTRIKKKKTCCTAPGLVPPSVFSLGCCLSVCTLVGLLTHTLMSYCKHRNIHLIYFCLRVLYCVCHYVICELTNLVGGFSAFRKRWRLKDSKGNNAPFVAQSLLHVSL